MSSTLATSLGVTAPATSSFGAADVATLGSVQFGNSTTAVTLNYLGTGEISDRPILFSGTTGTLVLQASGSGPLTLTNVITSGTGTNTGARLWTCMATTRIGTPLRRT